MAGGRAAGLMGPAEARPSSRQPSGACGPLRGGASAPAAHSCCSSGREIRGSGGAGGCSAGTYASSLEVLRRNAAATPHVPGGRTEPQMVPKWPGFCQLSARCCTACSYGARAVAMVDSWVFLTRPRPSLTSPQIGFVPKVFHTCGKNCGKPGCCHKTERQEGRVTAYFSMAKEVTARQDRGSGRLTGKDPVKTGRF